MNKFVFSFLVVAAGLITNCGGGSNPPAASTGTDSVAKMAAAVLADAGSFRDTVDGKPTALYVIKNKNNAEAAITNYGARVVSILVPDKQGVLTDIVCRLLLEKKKMHQPETYFGAIVGRYGNRIAKGKFKLEGKGYTLGTNNGPKYLHGGKKGFSAVVWGARKLNDSTLELSYLSKDGEGGYPANCSGRESIR